MLGETLRGDEVAMGGDGQREEKGELRTVFWKQREKKELERGSPQGKERRKFQ